MSDLTVTSKIYYNIGQKSLKHVDSALSSPVNIFDKKMLNKNQDVFEKENIPDDDRETLIKQGKERLKRITDKYNLVENSEIESPVFNTAKTLVSEFIEQYGEPESSSKEELFLGDKYDRKGNIAVAFTRMRKEAKLGGKIISIYEIDKLVRKYKLGNCSEDTELLTKMAIDKGLEGYNISQINYAVVSQSGEVNQRKTHVALLLTSRDNSEDSFVIDMWSCPEKGGIFKPGDWEKMMSEVYDVTDGNYILYKENTYTAKYMLEKLFMENISELEKEIPKENLKTVFLFAEYVDRALNEGKSFSALALRIYAKTISLNYVSSQN